MSLSNSYTALSASITGLHLIHWDRQALRPVFAALVRHSNYDQYGAAACIERQGFTRPGEGGRQASDAVMAACDRRNSQDGAWTVDASAAPGGTPTLAVRARGQAVSRHRWTSVAYDPPEFKP